MAPVAHLNENKNQTCIRVVAIAVKSQLLREREGKNEKRQGTVGGMNDEHNLSLRQLHPMSNPRLNDMTMGFNVKSSAQEILSQLLDFRATNNQSEQVKVKTMMESFSWPDELKIRSFGSERWILSLDEADSQLKPILFCFSPKELPYLLAFMAALRGILNSEKCRPRRGVIVGVCSSLESSRLMDENLTKTYGDDGIEWTLVPGGLTVTREESGIGKIVAAVSMAQKGERRKRSGEGVIKRVG
ncbi:hypothetical protein IE53DRAFT_390618 [Violaceomyces palustris]|uniref:Uncharacterized protein n=1 Tax=Violaceomyces palustris TaxID=1673888 RepID=A0ACD0NN42_9BASI|nr:hypothetical protein IE53DRAFT_390618 [Violaceomyces palustris]